MGTAAYDQTMVVAVVAADVVAAYDNISTLGRLWKGDSNEIDLTIALAESNQTNWNPKKYNRNRALVSRVVRSSASARCYGRKTEKYAEQIVVRVVRACAWVSARDRVCVCVQG